MGEFSFARLVVFCLLLSQPRATARRRRRRLSSLVYTLGPKGRLPSPLPSLRSGGKKKEINLLTRRREGRGQRRKSQVLGCRGWAREARLRSCAALGRPSPGGLFLFP